MPQFPNYGKYNREAETQRRINHNRKIDAIVEKSLKVMICDCGSRDLKQKRRGTYIVVCNSCNEEYKLVD